MHLGSLSRRVDRARRMEVADSLRRPRDTDGVVRGAGGFVLPGTSDSAVLLIHGFNDTPQSMRFLANDMNRQGFTVHVPRLPGHGVSISEMIHTAMRTGWQLTVRDEWQAMRARYHDVHLCGQSMGGALAVLLAAEFGDAKSLVLLAPYLGWPQRMRWQQYGASVLQWFTPYIRNIGGSDSIHDPAERALALGPGLVTARMLGELQSVAESAEQVLPELRLPTLYMQSRQDNRIRVVEAMRYFEKIGSARKELQWLEGCGHIISADYCRSEVAQASIAWFRSAADST